MNSKILRVHSSIMERPIVSECGGKLEIRGTTNLFSHCAHPLRQTDTLVRPVLHEHGLGPQSHSRLAIFSYHIQTRHNNAPNPFAPVVPTLLHDGSDPLIEVVVEHRQGRLADFQLCPIWHFKDILHQLRDSFAAHPKKLRLAIINEIKPIWNETLGREVGRRR